MLGKPVIKGTRITVELIVEKIAAGKTIDQLLADYPHITNEHIQAALAFVTDTTHFHGKYIDIDKSLEQIEDTYWPEPNHQSHLVTQCHALRRKLLKEFSIEDFRILIGQNISLEILIPLAIEELKKNILAEGDCYEGDLLKSVLSSEETYWRKYPFQWNVAVSLFKSQ